MKEFKKILVGVDLSWSDRFVCQELSTPNAEAVHQAQWIAKLNSASIEFLFALDLSARAQQLMFEVASMKPPWCAKQLTAWPGWSRRRGKPALRRTAMLSSGRVGWK